MALPTFGFSEEADMDSLITVVYRLRDFAFTIDQGETSTNVIILGVTYEEEELDPPCLRGLLLEDEETVVLIPLETIDRFTYRSVRRAP